MRRSARFVMIAPLVPMAALVYWYAHPPWSALRIAGLLMLAAGLVCVTLARLQLGDSFSLSPQAKQLVTHGIYSRVRNPIYVFSTIALAGLVLYLNMPYLLLFLLLLIPVQFLRARAEGRVLEARFGEQYREYKAGTWF